MSILAGLGSLGAVLGSTASLVHELKRPKISGEDFASLLRQQLQQNTSPLTPAQRQVQAANRFTTKFMDLHDVNRDGKLSLEESGFAAETQRGMDADQDGAVSALELNQAAMRSFAAPQPATHL